MNVVYFDGVCNLCNAAVNFLIDRDSEGKLKFASLQSASGEEVLARFNLPEQDYDSFILLKDGQLFQKSDAALEVVKLLGGGWSLLYAFRVIPRDWRDWLYTKIAQNRYRWFGKRDQCRLPTPELRERFV
ncbi:thiol-disulfide oxidoreductase DCC family protein [Persicitalea sp.]|uniref:thiol-disulfide oxidoreductase DCC family protein n=1 Tax=Persicitalea sp. TaxID=3100273 RepID=UPI0035948EC3